MAAMLCQGDPLADAVASELAVLGERGKRALSQGLPHGLSTLDDALPAVSAFLSELETVPDWGDDQMLAAGDEIWLLVSPSWGTLTFSGGSLAHTYSSPAIARLLAGTGQLEKTAARRLAETAAWKAAARTVDFETPEHGGKCRHEH